MYTTTTTTDLTLDELIAKTTKVDVLDFSQALVDDFEQVELGRITSSVTVRIFTFGEIEGEITETRFYL